MAAKLLNNRSAAFILYFYFAVNADNYRFALSPAHISNQIGLSVRQYSRARDVLVEAGYLIPKKDRHDEYIFLRVPERYADIEWEDIQAPKHQEGKSRKIEDKRDVDQANSVSTVCLGSNEAVPPAEVETALPRSIDQSFVEGNHQSPLEQGDQSYCNRGRNNITSTNNITHITKSPCEENPEDKKKLVSEWEERIHNKFGYMCQCEDAIMNAFYRARIGRYSEDKHIKLLEKCYLRLKAAEEAEIRYKKSEYRRACEATIPRDTRAQFIIWAILDRLVAEGRIPSKYGIWLQGWDEERQEVKLTEYSEDLPLDVVSAQKHIIEGIPEWYWRKQNHISTECQENS